MFEYCLNKSQKELDYTSNIKVISWDLILLKIMIVLGNVQILIPRISVLTASKDELSVWTLTVSSFPSNTRFLYISVSITTSQISKRLAP